MIACWKRSFSAATRREDIITKFKVSKLNSGMNWRDGGLLAPADSPAAVIRFGSPPKPEMFFLI